MCQEGNVTGPLRDRVPQVYAVTVYVEGEKAARELGVRQRGGFFDDNRCDSCC